MSAEGKCFCDLYRDCQQDPELKVSMGHDVIRDEVVYKSGAEFIKLADIICPGTSVFVGGASLKAANVTIDEDSVTFPREAVAFQCEYFTVGEMGS